jgi:hypothetical protein
MEQKVKAVVKGVAVVAIGAALVFLGVAVWIDGNTGFGSGLGFVGILIVVAWFGNVLQQRKKPRKT